MQVVADLVLNRRDDVLCLSVDHAGDALYLGAFAQFTAGAHDLLITGSPSLSPKHVANTYRGDQEQFSHQEHFLSGHYQQGHKMRRAFGLNLPGADAVHACPRCLAAEQFEPPPRPRATASAITFTGAQNGPL